MKPGRGRKPKPIELRLLQGNPSRRPIPADVPKADKLYEVPIPPEYLNDIAKECWSYLADKLIKCGIMSNLDVYTLEICCIALSTVRMSAKKIKEDTLVLAVKNEDGSIKSAQKTPYMNVLKDAIEIFDSYGSKLGLSPTDRMRLKEIKEPQKDNPLQEFIKHGKEISC